MPSERRVFCAVKCIELILCHARLFLQLILCETWEGGLWVFSGANGNFWAGEPAWGGEFHLGLRSNYINIYLYLCVPVWGAGGVCQRPTVLLYLTILHKGSKCEEFTWIAVAHWLFIYLNKMVYKLFFKQ